MSNQAVASSRGPFCCELIEHRSRFVRDRPRRQLGVLLGHPRIGVPFESITRTCNRSSGEYLEVVSRSVTFRGELTIPYCRSAAMKSLPFRGTQTLGRFSSQSAAHCRTGLGRPRGTGPLALDA
jgi:hypothetical protein